MTQESLAEPIAEQLRRDILRGRLAPGDPIKERDSAAELGVSRTPMREAIRILAREGLVVLRPSRSPVVANPGLQEIADDVEVLSILELRSAVLACERASGEALEAIRMIQREFDSVCQTIDPVDAFEIDMRFHTAIAEASGNRSLAETHARFLARLWRVRYLSAMRKRTLERVMREHRMIAEGLVARDPEQVTRALGTHLDHLMNNVSSRFTDT